MNIFGYKNHPDAKGLGDLSDPSIGGYWKDHVIRLAMRNALYYPIVNIGLSRHGHQYAHSHNFRAWIRATLEPLLNIQEALIDLTDIDVDTATGVKLDLIGRIVGAPAVIPEARPLPGYFGFDDQELAETFGEFFDESIGGHWAEFGDNGFTDYILTEAEYKRAIRAQILKNSSLCTPHSIIEITKAVLSEDTEFIYTELPMTIVIAPVNDLDPFEISLLNQMIPRPMGVKLGVINGYHDDFGFKGQHKALPMGETDDPSVGGYWSSLKQDLNEIDEMGI